MPAERLADANFAKRRSRAANPMHIPAIASRTQKITAAGASMFTARWRICIALRPVCFPGGNGPADILAAGQLSYGMRKASELSGISKAE